MICIIILPVYEVMVVSSAVFIYIFELLLLSIYFPLLLMCENRDELTFLLCLVFAALTEPIDM